MSDRTTTRTLRFEVIFPGLRDADRLALYRRLWVVSDDLTRASNRLVSALWQVRLGALEPPLAVAGKHAGEPVPLRTLAYQGLSGKWRPFGRALYAPEGSRAGSGVLCETAALVYTRLSTDFDAVRRGEKALSTFRALPLCYRAAEVSILSMDRIVLTTWAVGGSGSTRIRVRPRKLDAGQRATLQRILDGTCAHGSARLGWFKRDAQARGKWMLSVAVASPVARPVSDRPLVAGVHLGIANTVSMAYADATTGEVRSERDRIQFPAAAVRSWNRVRQERIDRSVFNRAEYGLRTGHGRQRKGRVVEALGEKVSRLTTTVTRQTAAAVVAAAKRRGAVALYWEDLVDWSVGTAHAEADEAPTRRAAAAHRRWYFQWHQGMLRAAIRDAAEREGLVWLGPQEDEDGAAQRKRGSVSPAYDSRTCSVCGVLWKDTGVYAKKGQPPGQYGRISWHRWACSCGAKLHADRNAAVNVAKRGWEKWLLAGQAAAK